MFESIKNFGSDIFDPNKILFNKRADKFKVRICNSHNLIVSAIKDNEDLIIYPTQISNGDIVVDMYGNRFYISNVTKEPIKLKNKKGEDVTFSVLRLKTSNEMLSDMFLSSYLCKTNAIIKNQFRDINGNNNIINIDSRIISDIDLPLDTYWKKIRSELKYSFNNPDYDELIDEIDLSMAQKRPIDENKCVKALKKIGGFIRDAVLDLIAKYLANLTK